MASGRQLKTAILGKYENLNTSLFAYGTRRHVMASPRVACSRLRDSVKSRSACSVKRNTKNARGLGRDRAIFLAATAPFPKSRASFFRFARFNTSALYYLRAWHRLPLVRLSECLIKYFRLSISIRPMS